MNHQINLLQICFSGGLYDLLSTVSRIYCHLLLHFKNKKSWYFSRLSYFPLFLDYCSPSMVPGTYLQIVSISREVNFVGLCNQICFKHLIIITILISITTANVDWIYVSDFECFIGILSFNLYNRSVTYIFLSPLSYSRENSTRRGYHGHKFTKRPSCRCILDLWDSGPPTTLCRLWPSHHLSQLSTPPQPKGSIKREAEERFSITD